MIVQRTIPDYQALTPLSQGQTVSDTAWNGLVRNIQHLHGVGVYGGGMSVANDFAGYSRSPSYNLLKAYPVSLLAGYNFIGLTLRLSLSTLFFPGEPTQSEQITVKLNRSGSAQLLGIYSLVGYPAPSGATLLNGTAATHDIYLLAELTESVRAGIGNRERAYITIEREMHGATVTVTSGVHNFTLINYKEC